MYPNTKNLFNAYILKARHLPIVNMVGKIKSQIMNQMVSNKLETMKWHGVSCPKMNKKLKATFEEGMTWTMQDSSKSILEENSRAVDIENQTCSYHHAVPMCSCSCCTSSEFQKSQ